MWKCFSNSDLDWSRNFSVSGEKCNNTSHPQLVINLIVKISVSSSYLDVLLGLGWRAVKFYAFLMPPTIIILWLNKSKFLHPSIHKLVTKTDFGTSQRYFLIILHVFPQSSQTSNTKELTFQSIFIELKISGYGSVYNVLTCAARLMLESLFFLHVLSVRVAQEGRAYLPQLSPVEIQ